MPHEDKSNDRDRRAAGPVSSQLHVQYGITAIPGRKVECPFCGRKTFSIKADDSLGKCFHPACGQFLTEVCGHRVDVYPPGLHATVQQSGLTLAQYAAAKQLPIDLLRALNMSDTIYFGRPALRIPYFDEQGREVAVRYRLCLEKSPDGDNRFRWEQGATPVPYGLWLLSDARTEGAVVICEGESDAHTLWFHAIPAVGIPGANSWKESWAGHLEGIPLIYVVIEPDAGGEAVRAWLEQSSLRHRARLLRIPGVSDPSELHCVDPENFARSWETAVEAAEPCAETGTAGTEHSRDSLLSSCGELARAKNILDRFIQDISRRGLAGEERAAQLLYLALTSRLLEKPVSISVKGPSSGGKSFVVEQVLAFFPESAFFALSAMSERALAYSQVPLCHRFLILYEAAGVNSETATYLLRSLLSEGHVRYETVEKTRKGLEARLIERPGPTGLIVTTTAIQLHPENETRLLSIPVTDSPEQTHAVLVAIAEEDRPEIDLGPWVALQEWLALGGTWVTVPFSREIASRVRPVAVRLRRDFLVVLNLIRAHALLHQLNRPRDPQGRIVATLEDYSVVRQLVSDLLAEGAGTSVPPIVRDTVAVVTELLEENPDGVSVSSVAHRLELDKSAASRRIRQAIRLGYLVNQETHRGRPFRLDLGEPLPEAETFLPGVAELECCTVARQNGGIETTASTLRQDGVETALIAIGRRNGAASPGEDEDDAEDDG